MPEKNYQILELGPMSGWDQFVAGPLPKPGRKFLDKEIQLEFFGVTINSREPGEEAGYWHSHKALEELYLFLEGQGEMALDDTVVPVQAGTAVRVGQGVMRTWRCLPGSQGPLRWICIRAGGAKLAEITGDAHPITDLPFPW